ncbi:uncharacterized protein LOC125225298 isoform X2 [Leguminivora glycinivorella]|nr:uncharacterized protein LOC125225298 isoform X2 [Leguminivora glycinivorella]
MVFKPSNYSLSLKMAMQMKRNELAKTIFPPVKITCGENPGEFYCSDEWLELLIHLKTADTTILCFSYDDERGYIRDNMLTYMFEVNIEAQLVPKSATMPTASPVTNLLYLDEEFTDFQLQGTDGNVPIHKSVLLAHNDMAKTMLRDGKWEETKNGCMKIDKASVETLNHLKAYMYLEILPEEGLEPLLLIASCYLMEKLRNDCIAKVARTLKEENIERLVEFACENNMPDLVMAIISNKT